MIKHSGKERKGVALLTCIVLMALSSSLLIAVVVEMINLETKAQNLALSAQEIAVGFLLEEAVAKIPTMMSPIPGAKVNLKVQETSKSSYTIDVSAEYAIKDKKPVSSALSGSFLIKTQDGKRVAISVGK
ncbi:hypothetical protein EBS67_08740 [bacterium]|nr:hypothetical protein [bacterium]